MTTQTLSPSTSPIRRPLLADGAFCAITGLIFTVDAEPIRAFVGLDQSSPILVLGLILLAYGIGLYFAVTNRPAKRNIAVVAMSLCALWVIVAIPLLIANPFHFSNEGRWALLILSDVVAALGIWEFIGLRRMARN